MHKRYSTQVYPEVESTPRSEFKSPRSEFKSQSLDSRSLHSRPSHMSQSLQYSTRVQESENREKSHTVRYLPRRETNLSWKFEEPLDVTLKKAEWIAKTFSKKECIRYVHNPKKPGNFCCCGRSAENHIQPDGVDQPPSYESTLEPERPWDIKRDVRKYPTDAFGKIEFVSEREGTKKPAKYVRLSDDTPPGDIIELFDVWKLPRPNLVISITGGAKNYKLGEQHAEVFSRGLINAAQTTSTWLLTGGTNIGIVKAVGDAVREGQRMQWVGGKAKRTVRCLGVVPWGYIEDHDALVSSDGKGLYPAKYKVNPVILRGHPVPLNPDHTHIIMVDNGTDLKYGVELNLRAEIERIISAPFDPEDEENSGLAVPVAMLLIEGGVDAIRTVRQVVSRGIPAIICEGTGRAADILSYAHHKAHIRDNVAILKKEKIRILKEKLVSAFGDQQSEEKLESVLKDVQDCIANPNLLTVFDMDEGDKANMDLAILTALLKGSGVNWKQQIELALSWNCIDVARERIFTDDHTWKGEELHDFMTMALIDNKVDFVKLLLENGVIMQEYLTVARLRKLYNSAADSSNFRIVMKKLTNSKRAGPFSLRDVGQCIGKMMGAHFEPLYLRDRKFKGASRDLKALVALSMNLTGMSVIHKAYQEYQKTHGNNKVVRERREGDREEGQGEEETEMGSFELTNPAMNFEKPFRELFLWAILMGRLEMAEFLWELGDEAISSGIAAVKIFSSMSEHISDPEDSKGYNEDAKKFEQLAVSVLDECYNTDEVLSEMLIERRHQNWGGRNILNIAAEANCKEFVAHACCQSLLNKIWEGGIKASPLLIVLALVFPCLMVKLKYKQKKKDDKLTPFEKIKTYINAPVSKFWGGSVSYIVFLLWYSYAILFNFNSKPTVGDILLFGWITTLIVEEFRQSLIPEDNETVGQKVRKWASSWWNIMDFLSIVLAITGFILRWFPMTFEVARSLYAVNGMIFFLRILRMFSLHITLGPKLIMIGKMLQEMLFFLMILSVFMIGYGIAAQALLYPNRSKWYWGIFRDVLYMPYFQIYGELFLEEIDPSYGDKDFPICDASNIDPTQSCSVGHPVIPYLMAMYLIVGNVLLLNLLIAIFSFVFEEVQTNSLQVWKYEVYDLVMEFEDRPALPPPFIIFSHIFLVLRWFYRRFKKKNSESNEDHKTYSAKHLEILRLLERDCAASYRKKKLQDEEASIEERMSKIEKKVDTIVKCTEALLQRDEMQRDAQSKHRKPKQIQDGKTKRSRKDSGGDDEDGGGGGGQGGTPAHVTIALPALGNHGNYEMPGPSDAGNGYYDNHRGAEKRKDDKPRKKNGRKIEDEEGARHFNVYASPAAGRGIDEVDGITPVEEKTECIVRVEDAEENGNRPDEDIPKKKHKKKKKTKKKRISEFPDLEMRLLSPEIRPDSPEMRPVSPEIRPLSPESELLDQFRSPSPKSALKSPSDSNGGSREPRKVRFSEEDMTKLMDEYEDDEEEDEEDYKRKKKRKKRGKKKYENSFMLTNMGDWRGEQIAVPIDNGTDRKPKTMRARWQGEFDLYHASDSTTD
ncbi:transient receptor potential cation channel subfamily M member 8-like [Glandiceps talaboti]